MTETTRPFGRSLWFWSALFIFFGLTWMASGYPFTAAGVGLCILIILWSEGELKWKNQ